MIEKNWKKEVARDVIAIGGIPFYIIILVRILTLPEALEYLFQFIFAGIAFFLLFIFFKPDLRLGLAAIAVILTSIYYNQAIYTLFIILAYIGMIMASAYLKVKYKQIVKGAALGIISALMGFFLAPLMF